MGDIALNHKGLWVKMPQTLKMGGVKLYPQAEKMPVRGLFCVWRALAELTTDEICKWAIKNPAEAGSGLGGAVDYSPSASRIAA